MFYVVCYVFHVFVFRYVLITSFMFFITYFKFVFLFCMFSFLFSVFCVSVFFCVLFSPHTHTHISVYKFTGHFHRLESPLQVMNIISYHIKCSMVVILLLFAYTSKRKFWICVRGHTLMFDVTDSKKVWS